jgi:hypothetical protein
MWRGPAPVEAGQHHRRQPGEADGKDQPRNAEQSLLDNADSLPQLVERNAG